MRRLVPLIGFALGRRACGARAPRHGHGPHDLAMKAAAAALVACALVGCSRETAIVVEVDWQTAMVSDADTLRIYVGTATADPSVFETNASTIAIPLLGLAAPYRHALEPSDGDGASIGDLQLAVALTSGVGPRPVAFVAAPHVVRFAAGEVRTLVLTPGPQPFAIGGGGDECVVWAAAGALAPDRAIGLVTDDDIDCDGSADGPDCQEFDPRITGVDLDGDLAICDDCFDGNQAESLAGWPIEPATVFPGQTEQAFRRDNAIPPNVACLHLDYDCSGGCGLSNGGGDQDGSKSDKCGSTEPTVLDGRVCASTPSDCDESEPGSTPVFGDAEVCDGADQSCDDRTTINLPCTSDNGPLECTVGVTDCAPRGTFGQCVPSGFPAPIDPASCAILAEVANCRFDDDPLHCAGGGNDRCDVQPASASCLERFQFPGVPGNTCDWRIVGGVDHAEWVIGFVGAVGEPLRATTTSCTPELSARPVHAAPTSRTVLIVGRRGLIGSPVAHFVTFAESTSSDACTGELDCTIAMN